MHIHGRISHLGFRIDAQGLHPVPEKVKAVQEAPKPRNVTELKSYLGLLSHYSKFLPNLSTVLAPLYKLLRRREKWQWKKPRHHAFEESNKLLLSWYISTQALIFSWHVMHWTMVWELCSHTKCQTVQKNRSDSYHEL